MSELHVIAAIFNPAQFASRYRLYHDFTERMRKHGVVFHTIELAVGGQAFAVTEADNPRHIQVRTNDQLWCKENLINVAIRRLPDDWEYVAWIDADIQFARPDWPQATMAMLRQHAVVQMFSQVIDLGPKYRALSVDAGFLSTGPDGRAKMAATNQNSVWRNGQPGFAWAARRKELEAIGGLIDCGVVGGGDAYMALGLTHLLSERALTGLSPAFVQSLLEWQEKCATHIRGNVGYVDDMIQHYWHGRRKDRGYLARDKIISTNAFDPQTDLKRDATGLLHLAGNKPAFGQQIEVLLGMRDEDRLT